MTGIIWYKKKSNGIKQFEQIIQNYQKIGILLKERKLDQIVFENNDKWYLISCSNDCCGTRCNISYIDYEIYDDAIDRIIRTATTLPPFNAIQYY